MTTFQTNIEQMYGKAGRMWLQQLPTITAELARIWHLQDLVTANNLSYNYIALGYQDGKPVALKISFEARALQQEMAALKAYQGNGCVKLIDSDLNYYNALLIERAEPGTALSTLFPVHDDQAVVHAVKVMQQLHQTPIPTDTYFSSIQDWLKDLETPSAALAGNYHIHKACGMTQELLAAQATPVLLHGDLHHDNILASGDHWLAIDPKGVLGEPAYEVGAFMRNPIPELMQQPNSSVILQQRFQLVSRLLGIDQQRLHRWAYVQAVLSGCWAVQDGNDDGAMAVATLLDNIV